jgi:hypothetical protein
MSHVSTLDLEIGDLEALDAACQLLGIELVRNQKTHKWYGRWVNDYNAPDAAYLNGFSAKDYGKCEHAIRIPGDKQAYEVGVARDKNGKLKLVYDNFCGGYGLEKVIGEKASVLRREYNMQITMKDAIKKGFHVERRINALTKKPQLHAWRNVK